MNDIFQDLLDVCVVVYLDDILVFSNLEDEHKHYVTAKLIQLLHHPRCSQLRGTLNQLEKKSDN